MSVDPAEKRGYAKGYAAGQRKSARADEAAHLRAMREQFERDVFLAVLPALIASERTWRTNGNPVTKSTDYSRVAKEFAAQAGAQFSFSVPPLPVEPGA